jgi:Anti-sigma regulatory factor (Ser/Thr protein kinase)
MSELLFEQECVLPAQIEQLQHFHTFINGFWQKCKEIAPIAPDEAWDMLFTTALAEIVANIIRYAYAPLPAPGDITITMRLFEDRVVARVCDRGVAYTNEALKETWDHDDLFTLPEGGMGLVIAKTAVDSLGYRRTKSGVNCWRLSKALS